MKKRSPRVAIVAAEFNASIVEPMIAGATDEIALLGATLGPVVRIPGCYEVPLVAAKLLGKARVDLLVVLGFIEKGETLHGQVMGQVVHSKLVDLEIEYGKPVGIGIIGPGATPEQAEVRKDAYARAAVRAALRLLEAVGSAS
jgi:6,7-dimethyl-8-ribityllumazine synthase